MRIGINQIGVAVFGISSILMLPVFKNEQQPIEIVSEIDSQVSASEVSSQIYVQVTGAVDKPGLYPMESGERVNDLLNKAGVADYNPQCINLAQILVDEQNIYIPSSSEQCVETSSIDSSGIVNVNTASSYELETIPGIGEAKAKAIVEYREANGTFQTYQQLTAVEGISEGLLQSIQQYIKLS